MTSIGMIGAGRWGSNWIRTLAALPGVNLRWCCDVNQASLDRVRRQFPAVATTPDLADLLDDGSLDGVVIATSAPTHFEVASRALQAGKHVLIEKPMTLTTAEAHALNRLARDARRVLMVGHLLEYHPAINLIQNMIASGELGDIYYIYLQRLNLGTVRSDENAWWSLAPHDISVACRLFGDMPLSVQCRGQNIVQPGIADVVFATLEFPGSRLAHIHVSWLDPHKTRKLTVVGSKKMVVFDDTLPAYKVAVYDKGFRLNQAFPSNADWITMRQGDVVMPKHETTEPLVCEARHFIECIRTGCQPISDGESGTRVVSVLEYGDRSLQAGGEVVRIVADMTELRRCA
ncbi:MAG: oxidoreductase [Gemmatales bacterium]|nr:MAG: oxidoreductase [Gemmatales bacterium]